MTGKIVRQIGEIPVKQEQGIMAARAERRPRITEVA